MGQRLSLVLHIWSLHCDDDYRCIEYRIRTNIFGLVYDGGV